MKKQLLKPLSSKPSNPKVFLKQIFKMIRLNKTIKQNNDYIIIIEDKGNIALCRTYYGKFWISKDKKYISPNFF